MYDFVEYCLRKYYKATGWNFDNQYVNLCASSRALLDFTIPRGMSLTMSRLPTPLFKPTYQINALPTLHGSLGYIFSSRPLDVGESAHVDIGEVVDWLRVVAPKTSPQNLEETSKDYMIYGRLFLPGGRLHALYTKRLSKHDQLVVTVVSDPVSYASSYVTTQLQHDVGKWCTECSYTTDDGLIGFRALYNIGPSQETSSSSPVPDRLHATSEEFVAGNPLEVINAAPDMSVNVQQTQLDELLEPAPKLENKFDTQDASVDPFNPSNDDKDTMPYDVYNGQWSVGAEIYYGTMDRKAGLSTAIRYRTLGNPDTGGPPPVIFSYTLNPIVGQMSAAYAAKISPDCALCSRYEFNLYSYYSDLEMGLEWRSRHLDDFAQARSSPPGAADQTSTTPAYSARPDGYIKARFGLRRGLALMWEGRYKNALFSLGMYASLVDRTHPIQSVGCQVQWFA